MASLADITPSPLPSITLGKKVYKFMPFSVRVKMHMEQVHSGIYQELARPDGTINLVAYLKVAFFAIADKTDLTFEKFCKLVDKECKKTVKDNQPTILDNIMQAVATWLEADAKKIERLSNCDIYLLHRIAFQSLMSFGLQPVSLLNKIAIFSWDISAI